MFKRDTDDQDEVDMLASDNDFADLDLQLLALAEDDKTARRKKKRVRANARHIDTGDSDKKQTSLSDLPKEVLKTVSATYVLLLLSGRIQADWGPLFPADGPRRSWRICPSTDFTLFPPLRESSTGCCSRTKMSSSGKTRSTPWTSSPTSPSAS